MNLIKRLALPLLVAGSIGITSTEVLANPMKVTGTTLTGRPDYDSNPGIGDTDINNDGRDDLKQVQQEAGRFGKEFGQEADRFGQQFGQETEKLSNTAEQNLGKLGHETQKGLTNLGNNLDIDDGDIQRAPWGMILMIGLVLLALGAILFAVTRRRRPRRPIY